MCNAWYQPTNSQLRELSENIHNLLTCPPNERNNHWKKMPFNPFEDFMATVASKSVKLVDEQQTVIKVTALKYILPFDDGTFLAYKGLRNGLGMPNY